jgi:hypothetical protein
VILFYWNEADKAFFDKCRKRGLWLVGPDSISWSTPGRSVACLPWSSGGGHDSLTANALGRRSPGPVSIGGIGENGSIGKRRWFLCGMSVWSLIMPVSGSGGCLFPFARLVQDTWLRQFELLRLPLEASTPGGHGNSLASARSTEAVS